MPTSIPPPRRRPDRLEHLLRQVAAGDEPAFDELYALTVARLTQVVGRTLRSPAHVVEVVQEVFLHAWQHAGSFDPAKGSALGWLAMLAHRRSVDEVRHVDRSVRRDHRAAEQTEDRIDDVAELVVARAEAVEVRRAVDRLPGRQREALLLTYFGGCTQAQAALALGVPLATLKSRAHAGVVSLRRDYGAAAA